jgi:hypothetical protein
MYYIHLLFLFYRTKKAVISTRNEEKSYTLFKVAFHVV